MNISVGFDKTNDALWFGSISTHDTVIDSIPVDAPKTTRFRLDIIGRPPRVSHDDDTPSCMF